MSLLVRYCPVRSTAMLSPACQPAQPARPARSAAIPSWPAWRPWMFKGAAVPGVRYREGGRCSSPGDDIDAQSPIARIASGDSKHGYTGHPCLCHPSTPPLHHSQIFIPSRTECAPLRLPCWRGRRQCWPLPALPVSPTLALLRPLTPLQALFSLPLAQPADPAQRGADRPDLGATLTERHGGMAAWLHGWASVPRHTTKYCYIVAVHSEVLLVVVISCTVITRVLGCWGAGVLGLLLSR